MCDTLCMVGRGGTLFAKNSDRPVAEPQVLDLLTPRPGQRPGTSPSLATQYIRITDTGARWTTVASRPTWLWGAEHGVNAAGLAVGNEKIFTVDDPRPVEPALLGMDLVRLALERAATASEGVEVIAGLLDDYGQGGSGEARSYEPYWSSFLLADPVSAWVVETSADTWAAEPVERSAAISNVVSLGTGWTRASTDVVSGADWDAWRDPAVPTAIADHRRAVTSRCAATLTPVAEPSAAAAEVVSHLRHHGTKPWGAPASPAALGEVHPEPVPDGVGDDFSGITVCMHVRDYQATTASMLAWMPEDGDAPIRLWASLGSPCATALLPGVLLRSGSARDSNAGDDAVAVIPEVLTDETVWSRLGGLARRVESPGERGREALRAIRAELGPVEARAWDRADELAAADSSLSDWETAAQDWSRTMRSALSRAEEISSSGGRPTS